MVVEDDPAVRDMTTQLLERAGYIVLAVGDVTEARTTAGWPTRSMSSSPTS